MRELPKDLAGCHKLIRELLDEVIPSLVQEIEKLKTQVNRNSNNSHRPPSTDMHKKPKTKPCIPRAKGKKNGGQKGHTGKALGMVEAPDDTKIHEPEKCSCGFDLQNIKKIIDERRQVFDLPTPKLVVTEHISMSCTCPNCDRRVKGEFPELVKSRVQYGNGVKALSVMLNTSYKIPFKKVGRLFGDLFGYKINDSETGVNVNGDNCWLDGFSNSMFTYLFAHAKRGLKAINSDQSIVPDYRGWMIHDCWSSYFKYQRVKHALCGSHLLRELQALIENDSIWAKRMHALLLYACHDSEKGKFCLHNTQASTQCLRRISRYF